MLQIECNSCQRKMRAPATAVGKSISCPCGNKIAVTPTTIPADTLKTAGPALKKHEVNSPSTLPMTTKEHYSHACSCGRSLRVARGDKRKTAKCPCGLPFTIPAKELDKVLVLRPVESPIFVSNEQDTRRASLFDAPLDLPAAPTQIPSSANVNHGVHSRNNTQQSYQLVEPAGRVSLATDRTQLFGSSALYGCAMMVGAIVWFVAGILFLDRVFIYPPIMFVLGLIGLVKGLLDGH